ncbi:peptidoglycan-recognition protein SC2-like [Ixodes scapularis]|uniref:peptidoglycan-recognition protein SC2-like n=1 Tax=Ixodes scapularis TaxID=6945 RepID=UPI001C3900F7|nr:peptidoglycan-recognition protein SC2-like [Ixodes scapularis]XP_040359461.2 peptidoglycan-recognition protein SC2-like [Ixodes scapularis]
MFYFNLQIGVRTQQTHSTPGIAKSHHHSSRNSIEHNAVNWESGKCAEIMLVRRKDWGARESKNVDYLRTNGGVTIVFYHHTEGLECNSVETCAKIIRQWQDYHMDTKRWDDIAYNFVIGGDGRVYEGRGFDGIGAHTLSYNSKSVSLAFVGNFTINVPNSKMLAAAGVLIECGVKSGKIQAKYSLHGQRDANLRDCPGEAIYALIQESTHFGGRLDPYIYTPRSGDLDEINTVQ